MTALSTLRHAVLLSAGILSATKALTQPVDEGVLQEVEVKGESGCWRATIRFTDPLSLPDALVEGRGMEAPIRVDSAIARHRSANDSLARPAGATPVRSITYRGDAVGGALLAIEFDRVTRYRVTPGPTDRSIVLALSDDSVPACSAVPSRRAPLSGTDKAALARLEAEAEAAIVDKNDATAMTLLGQILAYADNEYTPRARELVGLLQARAGRIEDAKRTFEDYLRRYPASEGRARVEQRLAAILGPIGEQVAGAPPLTATAQADTGWKADLRGVLSQFYYRDESRSEIIDARRPDVARIVDSRLNVDQILSATDVTLAASKGDTRIQLRAAGAITQDFRPVGLVGAVRGGGDTERISLLYLDVKESGSDLHARLGRQWLAGSGVFGRFDGAHAGVRLSPTLSLSALAGFPVQTPRDTHIDRDRFFYGASIDVDWPGEAVQTSLYWLGQRASGLTDRRAIGVTGRYATDRATLFGIIDYDIHFDRLSSAYLALNFRLSTRSSVTFAADYLHYPQLTTTSAIIGQPEPDLDVVRRRFERDFIKQLAKDRSQASRSLSVTYAQALSWRWHFYADLAVTRLSDAPASGGVLAIEGSGTDFYAGAQINGRDLPIPGASVAATFRYADVQRFRVYATDIGAQLPAGPKLKLAPRLRISYRLDKIGSGRQWTFRPSLRATLPVTPSLEFDAEVGATFIDQRIDDPVTQGSRRERSAFVNMGYRFTF